MVNYYKDDLSHIFYALADSSRREILELIVKQPRRATDLAKRFDITVPAISKHIRILEKAGFVDRQIKGREHHIAVKRQSLDKAYDWIEHYRNFWEQSLDRLEDYLQSTSDTSKTKKKKKG